MGKKRGKRHASQTASIVLVEAPIESSHPAHDPFHGIAPAGYWGANGYQQSNVKRRRPTKDGLKEKKFEGARTNCEEKIGANSEPLPSTDRRQAERGFAIGKAKRKEHGMKIARDERGRGRGREKETEICLN